MPPETRVSGLTRETVLADLRALGVNAGDLLMIHASLRKLGLARSNHGEGGADLLLDALDDAVGPGGTLMMVLGTAYPMDWVNDRPVGERAVLLAGWVSCLHDNQGIAAYDGEDYFTAILKAYLPRGRHHAGRVGNADGELLGAADYVALGARWMEANLG